MKKENVTVSGLVQPKPFTRRSQDNVLRTSGISLRSKNSQIRDQKQGLQVYSNNPVMKHSKTTSADTALHQKRRAILGDVTDAHTNSDANDIAITKTRPGKKFKPPLSNIEQVSDSHAHFPGDQNKMNLRNDEVSNSKRNGSEDAISMPVVKDNVNLQKFSTSRSCISTHSLPSNGTSTKCTKFTDTTKDYQDIIDIDSSQNNPLLCSHFVGEIYYNFRLAERNFRPSTDFMDTVQHDINQSMRGVLIDWIVEVCEEYRLVPDTLYLTVNLIDRFLSEVYIEKQRLQLLGITCLLIASKYEEICALHVEGLCFITNHTYTKEEVIKLETQVITLVNFRLSVPMTKTFLRRFIQAAQASFAVDSLKLAFMANYLAESTLMDYTFLNYIPSIIAASAVFLAKWTLDQSCHPWNPTLEHYTGYATPQLKATVLAMRDLQLNTCGFPLTVIREKYRKDQYKSVATLFSEKFVESLF